MPEIDERRHVFWCCHIRKWALVIGVLEILGLGSNLANTINEYRTSSKNIEESQIKYWMFVLGIIALVLWAIAVPLMFYGVIKEKKTFLIPHIVLQIFTVLLCIGGAIFYFIVGGAVQSGGADTKFGSEEEKKSAATASYAFGVILLIAGFLNIFFIYVFIRCYRYLKEKHG